MFPALYLHSIRLSLKEQEVNSMIQTSVCDHQGHYKLWQGHSIVLLMTFAVSHAIDFDKWSTFPSRLLVLHGLLDELQLVVDIWAATLALSLRTKITLFLLKTFYFLCLLSAKNTHLTFIIRKILLDDIALRFYIKYN